MNNLSYMEVSYDIVSGCQKDGVILSQQCHSNVVLEVKDGTEDLANCDGLVTTNKDLILGVYTADCAPVCISNPEKIAVVHAGWRGLCSGIIETALEHFSGNVLEVWIGPHIKRFEIQMDECYEVIKESFGEEFFTNEGDKIIFEFSKAIGSIIPESSKWDGRDTYIDPSLPSYRRDGPAGHLITMVKSV